MLPPLDNLMRPASGPARFALALAVCLLVALAAAPLAGELDLANIVMLFLLVVALVAAWLGRGPAVAASVASVALFDFLFVEPRFSFAVHDAQYLVTFTVMLAVALIIGELAARLSREAAAAAQRERRTQALYGLARELSGAISAEAVASSLQSYLAENVGAGGTLLLPDAAGGLGPVPAPGANARVDLAIARTVYERGKPMEYVDRENAATPSLALPLHAPLRVRGVLVVVVRGDQHAVPAAQRPLLDAVASLTAIAIERLHFVDVARDALVGVESERLRNSLLAALSHDLRTPLTVLVDLADSLARSRPALAAQQAELAGTIREQAIQTSRIVDDLLEMARLQAGRATLRKEWRPLEEVVGSSLKAIEPLLARRAVEVLLPPELPLVQIDAVLVERVLCNLLENATKYASSGPIEIRAVSRGDCVEVRVADRGPGLAPGSEEAIFRMFERGRQTTPTAGTGLGLAICRAIVEAHGGKIVATNREGGGASFAFTLPVGEAPSLDEAVMERPARELP